MQRITITGYLSRDAEKASTRDGAEVTRWNIPVKQGWGDKEQTNWYRVSIWGKRAEFAANARKGDFATVTGELTIGEYEGKPQYEVRADDFQAVKTAPRTEAQTRDDPHRRGPSAAASAAAEWGDDSDVPF